MSKKTSTEKKKAPGKQSLLMPKRSANKATQTNYLKNLRTFPAPHPVEDLLGFNIPPIDTVDLTDESVERFADDQIVIPLGDQIPEATGDHADTDVQANEQIQSEDVGKPENHADPAKQAKHANPAKQGQPVAPTSNFQKVTNTITQNAIPQGLFKAGKSKHVYDVLYGLTRGAIVPVRMIRISKPKLRSLSGVGSRATMDACLNHLESVGLIRQEIGQGGAHDGNQYEIFTPEEISSNTLLSRVSRVSMLSPAEQGEQGQQGQQGQILGSLGSLETEHAKQGYQSTNTEVGSGSKTLFKTLKQIDDETPLVRAIEKLDEAARAATGSGLTKKDLEAFESIVELLIDVTTVAATKTESVTTYLKFAEANLKKRLASAPRVYDKKPGKPFEPGSPAPDEAQPEAESAFEPEALTDEQRENALVIYRPLFTEKGIEALENARWQFTPEDYEWLMGKLMTNQ